MQVIASQPESISEVWLAQRASIAWSTVVLFTVTLACIGGLIIGLSSSFLTPIQAVPVSTLSIYLSFTVIHEAGHRNIAQGVQWMKPIERGMGWVCAIPFIIIPFSLFARIHDHHHAYTNDPDRDPDYWVCSNSWLLASIKSLALPLHYIGFGFSKSKTDPVFQKTWRSSLMYWVSMVALLGYLIYAGFGSFVLIAWVLPVVLASFILAMLFDWIPHRPNIQQSRYQNTRIYLAPFVSMVTLGQSYHLIHHLNPRIPWYAYRRVFDQFKQELENNDAPIENLFDRRLPRLFMSGNRLNAQQCNKAGQYTLTVKSIVKETVDTVRISFDSKEVLGFRFKAGQYITLSKVIDNKHYTRCYSICSSESSDLLSIAVKCLPNGVMSSYLNQELKAGDKLTVAGPFGDFVLNKSRAAPSQRLLMIAGGSGITPVMSMLRSAFDGDNTNFSVELIYCNRSKNDIIFKQSIDQLCNQYPNHLKVHYINSSDLMAESGATGRLTPSMIKALVLNPIECTHCYICGPEGLKNMAQKTLLAFGIAEQHIHCEDFALETKQPEGKRFNVAIEVHDGTKHVLQVAENQTVLEVAKQQGIELPYACGEGQCGCCMLTRVSGQESYASNEVVALLNEERKQGKTLACQCRPRSDLHLRLYNS